jgi:phenylacetaldehyde dehydrogenase
MAVAESVEQQADSFIHSPHKQMIDGQWVEAASGKTFETLNPATEEVLAEVAYGQAEDINQAVKAARRAFADDSPWRRMNAADRGRLIWKISELIEENADELAMLESLDNGKPYQIAKAADAALAADLFRYMAGWPTKIEGTTVPISALPAPGDYLAYTLREPVGVVGQIIPWNFPLLMAAWTLGPVLACGCTVVLNPAEQTPLSALRLGELLQEAGLPDGVVNIVTECGGGVRPLRRAPGPVERCAARRRRRRAPAPLERRLRPLRPRRLLGGPRAPADGRGLERHGLARSARGHAAPSLWRRRRRVGGARPGAARPVAGLPAPAAR